jgi:hypothetical protein
VIGISKKGWLPGRATLDEAIAAMKEIAENWLDQQTGTPGY